MNYRMVVEQRVSIGASRLKEYSELLTEISQKFGVPLSFWCPYGELKRSKLPAAVNLGLP